MCRRNPGSDAQDEIFGAPRSSPTAGTLAKFKNSDAQKAVPPEQVAGMLKRHAPRDHDKHVSHETISMPYLCDPRGGCAAS